MTSPAHVYQLDGSSWQGSACMGAVGAMALDAYTGGAVRATMHEIRAAQDDRAGGIGLDDVATAWRRRWGLPFTHGARAWATIRARLARGQGVAITCNYAALGPRRAPGSRFTGPHALWLDRLVPGGIVVNDPLRRGPVTLPEAAVQLAYTGGAGWGTGTYAGTSATSATSATCSWAAALGKGCAAPLTAADLERVAEDWTRLPLLIPGTGFPFTIPNPFADLLGTKRRIVAELAPFIGRPVASLEERYRRPGWVAAMPALPVDPITGLVGALTNLPDTLARGGIVVGLVALGLLGVALTFREPLTVAVRALPAARTITATKGLARV